MGQNETGPVRVIDSLQRSERDMQNRYGDPGIKGWLAGRGPLEKVETDSVSPKYIVLVTTEMFINMLRQRLNKTKKADFTSSSREASR